ncbi:hypothetical protein SEA_SATIS_106 [Streptomyces phage Satis]|nr:hypothetical protein SEA_SATIS_106 [Streptomyces phage Satis]QBZ72004.1 hypothetical protein SEA_KRADAL_106 [Streptomyces phage Kradal]QPL14424.1 hypothetical protein SEA_EHYELIMAYOE_107 [Streptomyces phage EhyElimayoE]
MSEPTFDRNVLSNEAGRLLTALLGQINEIGRAQVGTAVLLKESGLTQGALVRARTELTQQGLLRTEPGFSSSGLRGANVYVLNMTVLDPPSASILEDETGRTDADDSSTPGHPVSGEVPAPSGRHRSDRPSLWSRLLGKGKSS